MRQPLGPPPGRVGADRIDTNVSHAGASALVAAPSPRRVRHPAAWPAASWPVLAVCLGCGFTTLLDSAVLNIAVPSMRRTLEATTAESQWILASYSLTFGLALVPAGRVGDVLGRRRLLLAGLGVFAAMSLVSAGARAPWMVILARLAQGAAAGTISSQVLGLIQDSFAGQRRAQALGYYSVVTSMSGIVGPLLAGVAVGALGGEGWRVALLLSTPVAAATLLYGVRNLSADTVPQGTVRAPLDVVGLAILAVTTLLAITPFVGTWGAPLRWVAAGGAALGVLSFLGWERARDRRNRAALLPAALRRSRPFALGTGAATCWFAAQLGQSTVIALYLLEGRGLGPVAAAALLLTGSVAMGVVAWRSWRLVARYGRAGVTCCLLVQLASGVVLLVIAGRVSPTALVVALVAHQLLAGLTSGGFEAPNRVLTLAHAPLGAHGVAAGVLQLSQRLGATISIAAVTAIAWRGGAHSGSVGLRHGLAVCTILIAVAAALSAASGRAERRLPSSAHTSTSRET